MAKKRKLKKPVMLLIGIIAFFIIYFISFKFGTTMDKKTDNIPKKVDSQEESNKSLISQLKEKEKIYISDDKVSDVKIEEDSWEEIVYSFAEFKKVRNAESYHPVYEGYSDDGIKFSTDFDYFRVYTVSKEEYFKIPVNSKKEFKDLIDKSLYTSFNLVSQYKSWETAEITYGKEVNKIHKWKFDDLSHKMVAKRLVGKVQPEKSKGRSDYNFTVDIAGENYKIKLETMGRDYVKVTSKGTVAYYEVYTGLYDYIKNDIFKIK